MNKFKKNLSEFLVILTISTVSLFAALSDEEFEKRLAAGDFGTEDQVFVPVGISDSELNRRLKCGDFGYESAVKAAPRVERFGVSSEPVMAELMRILSLEKVINSIHMPQSSVFLSLKQDERFEVLAGYKRQLISHYYQKFENPEAVKRELLAYTNAFCGVDRQQFIDDLYTTLESEAKKFVTKDKNVIFLGEDSEQRYQEHDYEQFDQDGLGYHYRQIAVPYQPDNLCSYYSLYNALCLLFNDEDGLRNGRHHHGSGIFKEHQDGVASSSLEKFITGCRQQENIPGRDGIWEHAEGLVALIERPELGLKALGSHALSDPEEALLSDRLAPNVTIINDWNGFLRGVFSWDLHGNMQENIQNLLPFEGAQLLRNIDQFRRFDQNQIILLNLGNHWITIKLEKSESGVPSVLLTDSLADLHQYDLAVAAVVAVFAGNKELAGHIFEAAEVDEE